jgi:UPF0755 protein
MDILPRRKSNQTPQQQEAPRPNSPDPSMAQPTNPVGPTEVQAASTEPPKKPWSLWAKLATGFGVFLFVSVVGALSWYNFSIGAVDSANSSHQRLKFQQGSTAQDIANILKDQGLIRSKTAFRIYTELTSTKRKLQAGTYLFSANQSVSQIVEQLVKGKTDAYNMTIPPGLTLGEIKKVFLKNGFGEEEVDAALSKQYTHPLLASKPAEVNNEGYIYPETYQIDTSTTAEALVIRSFDQFQKELTANNLPAKLQARGFTLHQAVTLASMVQKEVSKPADQPQVAQVFEKRLHDGIQLGSDVTYIYAAKLLGVEPRVDLDSPYNTRKYPGYPPGAIANFNLSALKAVADPAPGDYVYFVAGDDGTTHFSHTFAEHEENIHKYCHKLCTE